MALADHKPARKRGHLDHLIDSLPEDDRATLLGWLHDPSFTAASIGRILRAEGYDAENYHVVHWRNRNVKGANK